MAWGKVDDKLHASVKWRRTTKGGRALWTTALSWCSDQENGGQIPADMLRVLDGTPADAKSLVNAGLWDTTDDGWEFHDWAEYNPDSASARAVREAKSDGGRQGNHARWHVKRKVRVPGCPFCEADNPSHTDRISESGPNRPEANPPDPTRPDPSQKSSTKTSEPRKRGSRIPDDFTPSVEGITWAGENCPDVNIDKQTAEFIDYWRGVPGQKGVKLDWEATWRNDVRRKRDWADERKPANPESGTAFWGRQVL